MISMIEGLVGLYRANLESPVGGEPTAEMLHGWTPDVEVQGRV